RREMHLFSQIPTWENLLEVTHKELFRDKEFGSATVFLGDNASVGYSGGRRGAKAGLESKRRW
ncbi:MAG: hypothetical protein AAGJ31_02675, partial [Verrucomicrobiota bacterium]